MRLTREEMYMDIAGVIARRSTCFRANVGAVVVHNKNIVAIGYNGPPPGEEHCTGLRCPGSQAGCTRAIHAERNALARIPTSLSGDMELFTTHSPCVDCAIRITFFGRPTLNITKLYFRDLYRVNEHLDDLIKSGIQVFQLMPAGFLLNWDTKEFVL